jgi:hypothetical protein
VSAIGGRPGPDPCDPHLDAHEHAGPKVEHPVAERLGEAIGLGLGVVVTEGLRLVPGWNRPVVGSDGKPVACVPGAERRGDYAIRKRHEEVVGPAVTRHAEKMKPGILHDLVAGFGIGATQAPGASYRLDARIDDFLHPRARRGPTPP